MLLLAAGLDPERCTLFVQSHVPEHTELTWLLNCVATFGELRRMTQFKEKAAKGGEESVSVGLFDYPVLMAADILAYDTDEVPVGDDQRQHLELARDIAIRFNHRFGDTLRRARRRASRRSARGSWTSRTRPPRCRSRDDSPQGTIALLDDPKAITKQIKSAVTDSDSEVRYDPATKPGRVEPAADPRRGHRPHRSPTVEAEFAGSGYGALKSAVADAVVEFVAPAPGALRGARARPGRGRPHPRGGRRPRRGDRRDRCSHGRATPPGCSPAAHGLMPDDLDGDEAAQPPVRASTGERRYVRHSEGSSSTASRSSATRCSPSR